MATSIRQSGTVAFLFLAMLFQVSCSTSEDRAGKTGAIIGGIAGAVIGAKIGEKSGQKWQGGAVGGVAGAAAGDAVGRKSSTLKGVKKTELE